jgi:hypothetical protein
MSDPLEPTNIFGLDDGEIDTISAVISIDATKKELVVRMKSGKKIARRGGTISWRCNNPGNLKFGEFAKKHGAVGPGPGNHAVFPSYFQGLDAQEALLFSPEGRYFKRTITEAMSIYAPVSDPDAKNDPIAYANFVARKIGVSPGVELSSLNPLQRIKMLFAMHQMEGYKEGTEVEC